MGYGYTGNHPRYTMIHDHELIADAKKQMHEADKSLKAYDKAATKKVGDKDQTLMAYDRAATKMLPGTIHPLSDVYGKVRNLEQYNAVDDHAAAKQTSMKNFPLNSPERRAEYDRRNWKQDETTELGLKDKVVEGAKNMMRGVAKTAVEMAPSLITGGIVGPASAAATNVISNMLKKDAQGKPNKKGCSYKK